MRLHKNRISVSLGDIAYRYVFNCAFAEQISISKAIEHVILMAPARKLAKLDSYLDANISGKRVTVNLTDEAYSIVQKRAERDDISMTMAVERYVLETEAVDNDNY